MGQNFSISPELLRGKTRELLQEIAKAKLDRARLRFERTHQHINNIYTGKMKTNPVTKQRYEVIVPVFKDLTPGLGSKKYPPQKLRDIRQAQAEKALEGQTHYADGTPIIRKQVVDLPEFRGFVNV